MSQADLKSDDWCSYNQAAASAQWVLQNGPDQGFNNTFSIGSVGINASFSPVRADVINIDSYLSGRDDILSKCNPPVPSIDEANEPPLHYQNERNVNLLQPIYTKEKASSINLSAVSYIPLTFEPELPSPPQDINHIIFNEAQRGGINTSNLIKNAWNSDAMEYFLDPQRACGQECSEVNGYMTRMPYSRENPEATWGNLPTGLPSKRWNTPGKTNTQPARAITGVPVTSQMLVSLGAAPSGPQFVVPTSDIPGSDYSPDRIPRISNPWTNPPQFKDPKTGKYYFSNPMRFASPS
jgi:hypothetical protein